MPPCSVFGCRNNSKRTKGTEIKYYGFPKDNNLAKQWTVACQRGDKFNVKFGCVCSVHFEPSCFFIPLRHRLLNYTVKNYRYLKPDAVPTKNLPSSSNKKPKESDNDRGARLEKRNRRVEVQNILKSYSLANDNNVANSAVTPVKNNEKVKAGQGKSCDIINSKDPLGPTLMQLTSSNWIKQPRVSLVDCCRTSKSTKVSKPLGATKNERISSGESDFDKPIFSVLDEFTLGANETIFSEDPKSTTSLIKRPQTGQNNRSTDNQEEKCNVKNKVVHLNPDNICRVCGRLSDSLESIFNNTSAHIQELDIPVLIHRYLPVMVDEEEIGSPKNICDMCIKVLTDWDKLYKKCVAFDRTFIKLLIEHEMETSSNTIDIASENMSPSSSVSISFINGHDYAEKNFLQYRVKNQNKKNGAKDNVLTMEKERQCKTKEYKTNFKMLKANDCLRNDLGSELDLSRKADKNVSEQNVDLNESIDCKGFIKTSEKVTNKENVKGSKVSPIESGNQSLNKPKNLKVNKGPALCAICGQYVPSRRLFLRHKIFYHDLQKCNYCGLVLTGTVAYKKHVKMIHPRTASESCCELCGDTFITSKQLVRHKLLVHNIGEYHYCDLCDKKFTLKMFLVNHKSECHPKRELICKHCDKKFATRTAFSCHLRTDHREGRFQMYQCNICGVVLSNSSKLLEHYLSLHRNELSTEQLEKLLARASKVYPCIVCGIRSADIETLKEHLKSHENDIQIRRNLSGQVHATNFGCTTCRKYFITQKSLGIHRYYSHKFAPFSCIVSGCQESFWKVTLLKIHRATKHGKKCSNKNATANDDTSLKYKCSKCPGIYFDSSIEKSRHMRTVHHRSNENGDKIEKKFYACDVCDKSFNTKYILSLHMTGHSDVRDYKCPYCDRFFKLYLTMRKHVVLAHENYGDDELVLNEKPVEEENVADKNVAEVYKQQIEEGSLVIEVPVGFIQSS